MSRRTRVFAEHSHRLRRVYRERGTDEARTERRWGACVETHDGRGHVTHRFADGADLFADRTRPVGARVAQRARGLADRPLFAPDDAADKVLRDLARDGTELTLGVLHQHVAAGDDAWVTVDERLWCTVEVGARAADGTHGTEVVPWPVDGDAAEGAERVGAAVAALRSRLALPLADTVPEGCDLVLDPGRAGAFFHELVGHPMEADVVASGTSYLGRRADLPVAPGWLTVVDGGGRAARGLRSAVDDEGTACRDAVLIDGGRVGEPMTDLATAGLLGTAPTGHGRRLDYRHPAIPRMTHTAALVGDAPGGTGVGDAPGGIGSDGGGRRWPVPRGEWIAPLDLQLQVMNIATGAFVFRSYTPLHHGPDGTVRRLPPLDLRGDGLTVLAGLAPVTTRAVEYGRATKGCGKLGQFPLVVTFANAGVRIPSGLVGVREARDG
ncbi:metallopeptidase TldD-related protein [Streptomyces uncialis]|uniref:metallopeptidase TldD-related protein n=1 Tax=Streptomyces uncialis TaxID=1048205 RepID=UPI00386EB8FB|nr:metallopeptidase TldD-related protein [Streptomyces uncialis]